MYQFIFVSVQRKNMGEMHYHRDTFQVIFRGLVTWGLTDGIDRRKIGYTSLRVRRIFNGHEKEDFIG